MEKNRNIPIDQFFADLRQYEAAEPSVDSWMQMKTLLDQELPEGRQLSTTFRKRYLLPLLLLFIGGTAYLLADRYYPYKRPEASVTTSAPSGQQAANDGPSGQSPLNKEVFNLPAGSPLEKDEATNGAVDDINQAAARKDLAGRNALTYADRAQKALEDAGSQQHVLASRHRPAVVSDTKHPYNLPADASRPAGLALTPPASPKAAEAQQAGNASGMQPARVPLIGASVAGNTSETPSSPPKPVLEERIIERLYPEGESGGADDHNQADDNNQAGENYGAGDKDGVADDGRALAGNDVSGKKTEPGDTINGWIPVNTASNEEIVQNEEKGGYFRVDRDTFKRVKKQLTTVKDPADPRRREFQVDTLSITRIEKITYSPITYPAPAFAEKNYRAAFASSSNALENTARLVPLSSYKVASKKIKPAAFTSLKRTANGLESLFNGEKDWYMAVFAGGHAPLGNPGSLGIQAGIAALYTFRERWVLSAEARFMKTYFPGYKLLDASSNFELNKSQVPGGWLFSGTESVTTNAYNLQLLNSLHVPVTLSYNFGRVSAFGGLDFSYSFPLKWEKETSFSSLPVSQLSADGQNPFLNETFSLNEQAAFKARFGLGYVGGLSYDFSRKLSLDVRIRQTLWDNAHYELNNLKKLYRRPSAELTLGFYFGRREKVVYILDTHR